MDRAFRGAGLFGFDQPESEPSLSLPKFPFNGDSINLVLAQLLFFQAGSSLLASVALRGRPGRRPESRMPSCLQWARLARLQIDPVGVYGGGIVDVPSTKGLDLSRKILASVVGIEAGAVGEDKPVNHAGRKFCPEFRPGLALPSNDGANMGVRDTDDPVLHAMDPAVWR